MRLVQILRNAKTRFRTELVKLLAERASPREVGQAIAIGVWAGTSPAFGLHGWIAVGLATICKRNRVFAFLGSRVSFFLLLPWIILSEIEGAHWARTRTFAPIDPHRALQDAPTFMLDWCLGWLVLGPVYAVALGLAAVPLWALWLRRRAKNLDDTPLPPPEPSSESPR